MGTTVAFQVDAFQEDAFQTYETIYEVDGSIVKFVRVYCRKADSSHLFRQRQDAAFSTRETDTLSARRMVNSVFARKRPTATSAQK